MGNFCLELKGMALANVDFYFFFQLLGASKMSFCIITAFKICIFFFFFFKGGWWCLLYFSPGNSKAQGEDEQGGQEEKEEVQDKVYTNVNNASISVSTLNSWNIKELHFVHYTKLLASSEYRMDPYFPFICYLTNK